MIAETIEDLSKKTFYHGSEMKTEELRIRPPSPEQPFYITLKKEYANVYSGEEGGIYIVKMARNANVFDPESKLDQAKVKKILPRLIRILWFGEELDSRSRNIATKDLMIVSLELTPTKEATYGSADDERLEDGGIVSRMVNAKTMSLDEAETALEELDGWLEKNGFDYGTESENDESHFNQIRTIILKILKKLGFQAYIGEEENADTVGSAKIYGVFDIRAIAEISAKPIKR